MCARHSRWLLHERLVLIDKHELYSAVEERKRETNKERGARKGERQL